jgi:predicted ATP-grasp superfamily ATP-dependent carboligase
VIGGGSANGLGIAWNLSAHSVKIYCVTSDPHELLCASKYCHGYMRVPDVEANPARCHTALQQLADHLPQPDILFPTTDTALLTIAKLRDHLGPFRTYIPSRAIVETCVIKTNFYHSLTKHEIPHPRTFYPEEQSLPVMLRALQFPVFIRPSQTQRFAQHFRGKGFYVTRRRALQHYLRLVHRHDLRVMVQEIIPGPVTNGYTLRGYLDQQSHPRVLYATQKLRQPSLFSNNTAWVTIPLSTIADFANVILNYLRTLGYTGLFGAEFKRDPRDGRWKLLEINARSMGGNYLGAVCGANHVRAAYLDTLGEPVPRMTSYRSGVYYLNDMEDLLTLVKMSIHGDLTGRDLIPFVRPKQWQQWSTDDPRPFLHLIRQFLQQFRAGRM